MPAARSLTAMASPRHRPVLWLALLLALFAALAPTVSRGLHWARSDNGGLIELCTSSGPRWLAPQAQQPLPDAPASAQVFDHCPFCLLLANRAVPPPAHWPLNFAAPGQAVAPLPVAANFLPVFFAPSPPSRAPPVSV